MRIHRLAFVFGALAVLFASAFTAARRKAADIVYVVTEPVLLTFREVLVRPVVFLGRLDLPSPVGYMTGWLKPEYRDSWRTHGLSLQT